MSNQFQDDAVATLLGRICLPVVLVLFILFMTLGCVNMVPEDYCLDVANQQVVFTWELGDD